MSWKINRLFQKTCVYVFKPIIFYKISYICDYYCDVEFFTPKIKATL